MLAVSTPIHAPELAPGEWLNSSRPLRLDEWRGRAVLVDIWDFTCLNCLRTLPYLTAWHQAYRDLPVSFLGIHSPEFEREHDRSMIIARAQKFGLHHPIMIDNDMGYWNALNNNYWPAYYLLDKQGRIRYRFYGETHAGDRQAQTIETAVAQLIGE